jgi:hypothetical protein
MTLWIASVMKSDKVHDHRASGIGANLSVAYDKWEVRVREVLRILFLLMAREEFYQRLVSTCQ